MSGGEEEELLARAMGKLREHPDIACRCDVVHERGIAGADASVLIFTFCLSGLIGGVLAAAGADLWKSIKALSSAIRNRRVTVSSTIRIVLVLSERVSGAVWEFELCFDPAIDEFDIAPFIAAVTAELAAMKDRPSSDDGRRRGIRTIRYAFHEGTLRRRR